MKFKNFEKQLMYLLYIIIELLLLKQNLDLSTLNTLLLLRRKDQEIRTRNNLSTQALPTQTRSSWSYLDRYGNDEDFINTVGIKRNAFDRLLLMNTEF